MGPRLTLGASHSVRLTTLAPSVTSTHRSDAAGHPGATRSVEAQCTRTGVVGVVVVVVVVAVALGEAVALGSSIQGGARAPSVGLTTQWATSATVITRCIAATTM